MSCAQLIVQIVFCGNIEVKKETNKSMNFEVLSGLVCVSNKTPWIHLNSVLLTLNLNKSHNIITSQFQDWCQRAGNSCTSLHASQFKLVFVLTSHGLLYRMRYLSCDPQYSLYISLIKNMWNTTIKKHIDTQKRVGSPPRWWPCLCSAMMWCSWAGAKEYSNLI